MNILQFIIYYDCQLSEFRFRFLPWFSMRHQLTSFSICHHFKKQFMDSVRNWFALHLGIRVEIYFPESIWVYLFCFAQKSTTMLILSIVRTNNNTNYAWLYSWILWHICSNFSFFHFKMYSDYIWNSVIVQQQLDCIAILWIFRNLPMHSHV